MFQVVVPISPEFFGRCKQWLAALFARMPGEAQYVEGRKDSMAKGGALRVTLHKMSHAVERRGVLREDGGVIALFDRVGVGVKRFDWFEANKPELEPQTSYSLLLFV